MASRKTRNTGGLVLMIIDEYFGDGMYANRKSELHKQSYDDYYYVKFFENDEHIETRVLKEKTLRYAEDCAENWTIGVING
jgi:hypothetical protein